MWFLLFKIDSFNERNQNANLIRMISSLWIALTVHYIWAISPIIKFKFNVKCLVSLIDKSIYRTTYIVIDYVDITHGLHNTNGFGIETMYDYYIVMKSMFLGYKIFSFTLYYLCKLYHFPSMNLTLTTPKPFKTKSRSKIKTSILTTSHSNHNFIQREVSLKVINTLLYTNQKETSQKTF